MIQEELAAARKRGRELARALADDGSRWAMVRQEIEECAPRSVDRQGRAAHDASPPPRTRSSTSAEDFIVEEDDVVLVSRDGWVKRQKDVKDLADHAAA